MVELRWQSAWTMSAHAKGAETAVLYQSPCCGNWHEINVQTPAPGAPVTTELWCHRDGRGAQASIEVA